MQAITPKHSKTTPIKYISLGANLYSDKSANKMFLIINLIDFISVMVKPINGQSIVNTAKIHVTHTGIILSKYFS